MTEPAAQLLELLRSGPASPRHGDEQIWDIGPPPLLATRGRREALERLRSAFLAAIASCGLPVFIRLPDEPPDAELASLLLRHPTGAWEVAGGRVNEPALQAELHEGGWFLYTAAEPLSERLPDPFKSEAGELADFMRRAGVSHFVASFWDDLEWVVGLGEAAS